MKKNQLKYLFIPAATLTAVCWAYSLAVRFTDFFIASRQDKLITLNSLLIPGIILSALLYGILFPALAKGFSKKVVLLIFIAAMLATAGIFSIFYKTPPFPEDHRLTITATGEKNILFNRF